MNHGEARITHRYDARDLVVGVVLKKVSRSQVFAIDQHGRTPSLQAWSTFCAPGLEVWRRELCELTGSLTDAG